MLVFERSTPSASQRPDNIIQFETQLVHFDSDRALPSAARIKWRKMEGSYGAWANVAAAAIGKDCMLNLWNECLRMRGTSSEFSDR